jgi:hypothetical protein
MRTTNGFLLGCVVALTAQGCSLTKLDPINEGSAGSGNDNGGAAGDNATGGKNSKGGTSTKGGSTSKAGSSSKGGTTAKSSNTNVENAAGNTAQGGATENGGSTTTGGASNSTSSNATGGTSTTGGTGNVGGTTAIGGTKTNGGTSNVGGTTAIGMVITTPSLTTAKTNVAYNGTVTASGAISYSWSIASGSLPDGLTLQNTTNATVTIGGTPTVAGVFPLKLAVTDGTRANTVDIKISVTHKVAFLSDRITTGVTELFLADVGAETVTDPVRLNTPLASAKISEFAWSPNGDKIAYELSNGDLRVVAVATPTVSYYIANLGAVYQAFQWIPGTSLLVFNNGPSVGITDVSGATPTSATMLTLPAVDPGATRSINSVVPAPNGKGLCVNYLSNATVGPDSIFCHASWSTLASVSVSQFRSSTQSGQCVSYSPDSMYVTTLSGSGGLEVANVTNPSLPKSSYVASYSTSYWDTDTNTLLSIDKSVSMGDLAVFRVSGSGVTTSTLVPYSSCTPAVGPWSPNGKHALYTCSNTNLYTIANAESATSGTGYSLLPAGFSTNPFTDISNFAWSPDSSWVVLRADRYDDSVYDLFLARWSSAGSATRPYSSRLSPGVSSWQFAPSSERIAYVGTLDSATVPQLYLSQLPTTGSANTAVQVSTTSGPSVQNDIGWLPGSRVVLYRANDAGGPQLHAVLLTATGTASSVLTASKSGGTGVKSFQVAPR